MRVLNDGALTCPKPPVAGEAFIGEEWFRSDLMALERDGKPLWDGKSEIYLREALAEEADQWRVAYARAQFKR